MSLKLIISAVSKLIIGFLFIFALIFIPAGTIRFLNGRLFIGLLFFPMTILGVVLMIKDPKLLKKRLDSKEKEQDQKIVVLLSILMFFGGFIIAGLDFRFSWFILPRWIVIAASVLFLFSYGIYAEVMRENAYLSRTVKVMENQKVVDTGLYGVVRHPMYLATILMFLSVPLILGSLFAFLVFLIYPVIIAIRIKNEEKVLSEELSGYEEYKKKVRYRIIPYIW